MLVSFTIWFPNMLNGLESPKQRRAFNFFTAATCVAHPFGHQDRFISKMFLRGDSVILVLRNPK